MRTIRKLNLCGDSLHKTLLLESRSYDTIYSTHTKSMFKKALITLLAATAALCAQAQVDAVTGATRMVPDTASVQRQKQQTDRPLFRFVRKKADTLSTEQPEKTRRFSLGGYGEAVMTRNFYSQSFNRYNAPERYRNDKSHGRFDLPHVTINMGYDFGRGWTMGTEIEFEHGGNETAVEIEAEESGEYEAETENAFRQLRLNQWVKQAVRWMPMDK